MGQYSDCLRLVGLQFHLAGYDVEHRVSAFRQICPILRQFPQLQHIDIGGGIPIRYLKYPAQWLKFQNEHRRALLGQREPITYLNHALGLQIHAETNGNTLDVYPPAQSTIGSRWLDAFLNSVCYEDQTIADFLRQHDIELRCEPGRSALAGCGLTIARVVHRKYDTAGNLLIGILLNRTQFRTGYIEVMFDPILIKHSSLGRFQGESGFFTGSYCTESDFVYYRRFNFNLGVDLGDILVLPNTAGYLMHFLESRSHQFPLANNVNCLENNSFELDEIDQLVMN